MFFRKSLGINKKRYFTLALAALLAAGLLGFYLFSTQAALTSVTWTTQDDFETNAITTGTPTTRTNIDTSSSPGDVKVASTVFNTGDGSDGDLTIDGTTVNISNSNNLGSTSYRKPLTINNTLNTNSLTDYQVQFTIDTKALVDAGKMQAEGDDIRFTDSDGTTLIPYWIESGINTTSTKMWVKVPSIAASSNKTIYMYYGNSSLTGFSNLNNTFVREINSGMPLKTLWRFDKNSSNFDSDYSGNNNTATLWNGGSIKVGSEGPAWISGKFGNALNFDGIDDYVKGANSDLGVSEAITVNAWVKIDTDTYGRIASKHGGGPYGQVYGWMLARFAEGDRFEWSISTNGSDWNSAFTSPDSFETNTWYHVVATYDGSKMRVYINGVEDTGGNLPYNLSGNIKNAPAQMQVARDEYMGDTFVFDGTIDEVMVYDRALTAAEVADLASNYGFSSNYSGKVLIRKNSSPEPTASVGSEETGGSFSAYYSSGSSEPYVLDGRHYFNSVTIRNGGGLTHSQAAGTGSGIEGLELYVKGTLSVDESSKIDITGKGYGASQGLGSGFDDFGFGAGGGAYGGAGGNGGGAPGGLPNGTPTNIEYMGSGGGNTTSTSGIEGYGGAGGGRLKIAAGSIDIKGSIQANGLGGSGNREGGGGGSGGGVYLASPIINMTGYISAAGGGGGGSGDGTPGFNGTGGNGGGGGFGGSPGLGGDGGNYSQNGGFSAGGGGLQEPPGSGGAGGGGAGRIAVYYGTFNGGAVAPSWDINRNPISGLPGEKGFADAPSASNQVGPYGYYASIAALIGGTIGEPETKDYVGLRADAGSQAKWKSLDWDAEALVDSQNIEFQIRVANSIEELKNATYLGWDGTPQTWFDSDHKDIPFSITETRYAEIRVKLSPGSSSPILHSVTLNYDRLNLSSSELSQNKIDGTNISIGEGTNESSVVLKAQNLQGMSDSTGLFAEFEAKPVNQNFGKAATQRFEENDSAITYAAAAGNPWYSVLNASASGGAYKSTINWTPPSASSLIFTFKDTKVTWFAMKSNIGGIARVYVDGVEQGTVDLYSASPQYQQPVFTLTGLANTFHTLRIEGTGNKSAGFGLGYINVDAIEVENSTIPQIGLGNVTSAGGTSSATISGLASNQEYHWRARVKDAQGRVSAWSSFGNNTDGDPANNINAQTDFWVDTIAPSIPGTPNAVSPTTDTTPTWSWNPSTDNESGIKGYKVYVGTSPGATDVINGDFTSTNSYTHKTPLALGDYYTYVKAVDKADNVSDPSGNGNVTISSAIDPSILAPTGLNVFLSGNDVNIAWSTPLVGDVSYYNIYRSYQQITNANLSTAELLASSANLTYVDLTTFASKTYYYQVTAVNTLGEESLVSTGVINDNVTIPGDEEATWTTKDDFENNASTTGTPTTRSSGLDTASSPGDVKLSSIINVGDGSEGNLVVDGTTASNSTDGAKHDSLNPLVINGIHNYRNVTLQNGAYVTHAAASGGMEIYATDTFSIDSSSRIAVTGKGFGAGSGPGKGTLWAGAGYGGMGGLGNNLSSTRGPSYGQADGSDGMQMGSGGDSSSYGGDGGGKVNISAKVISVLGRIEANGKGGKTGFGGGGSGGGILIKGNTVNINGVLSAAGGGGGGYYGAGEDGGATLPGYGGRGGDAGKGGAGVGGAPGMPPGNGGDPGLNGGFSAGGGGGPLYGTVGGGGAAGRIAIYYGSYNGGFVNSGATGYYEPEGSEIIGPYAYYSPTTSQTLGTNGGVNPGDVGLRLDAGNKAKWRSLDWEAEPLLSGQNIEFQIRVADTLAGLDSASYVGPDGTSNTWFDESNKTLPVLADTRYGELTLKLSSNGNNTPILHDVTLNYDIINNLPAPDLFQYKSDGLTILDVGQATNQSTVVLEAQGVTGLAGSTGLKAQFEVKDINQAFDETGLYDGSVVSGTKSNKAITLAQGTYHWRARVVDNEGRTSNWTSFGSNSDGNPPTTAADTDFIIDTTTPPKPATPTTPTPTENARPTWTWSASTDNLSGIKGYHVNVGTTENGADVVADSFVTTNSFTHSSSLNQDTYYATIRAEDKAGNISVLSDNGTVVIGQTEPANLDAEAEPAPSKNINLTWTGPSIGTIDHYNVYRFDEKITDANKDQAERIADDVKATNYTDGAGFPGQTYFYQVTAVNNSGSESGVSLFVINDQATVSGENPHGDYSSLSGRCRDCHKPHLASGSKKLFRKNPNVEICYTCHDGSGSSFNIKDTFKDLAAHEKHLASPTDTDIVCTNCHHPHGANNYLGVGGGERMTKKAEESLCLKCHDQPISINNWNVKEQFEKKSRHAITGTTADGLTGAKVECSSCHGPHTVQRGSGLSDLNSRLVDPTNTFNLWPGSFTDFCLKCHRSYDLPKKTATSEVFVPYTILFPDVSQLLFFQGWDKTPFKTSEHNAKGLTCQKCHQPHGSDNPRLNAFFDPLTGYDTGEGSNEERLCFKCHNSNKVDGAPDIRTPFEKASAHPAKRREKHKDTEGVQDLGELNRHAECQDCHDPHKAKAGLHEEGTNFAGHVLTGMKGVGVINGIPGVTPSLYYPLNQIVYEYQLCFKCHSSYVELLKDPVGDLKYSPQDKAVEFNPNNPSYHPVEASGKNLGIKDEAFVLGTPFNPTVKDDPDYGLTGNVDDPNSKIDPSYQGKITCTDCHGNDDSEGAQGPHGSINRKILRKPFYYTEEAPSCMNACHRIRAVDSQGNEDGNRLCFSCHKEDVYKDGGPGSRFYAPRSGFSGDRPMHPLHVRSGMLGGGNASCSNCHKIHGNTKFEHLLNSGDTPGMDWTPIRDYKHNADGTATCDPSCHDFSSSLRAVTYTPAYPRVSGSVAKSTLFEERADEITYTGTWGFYSDSEASGGGYLSAQNLATNNEASATLNFTGTKVQWISRKGYDGALARVYIDNQFVREVDLASVNAGYMPVFTSQDLPAGDHSITVKLKYRSEDNVAGVGPDLQELKIDAFKVTP